MNSNTKKSIQASLREFNDLIETIAKIEFKKLSSSYLIDYSEFVNIGTQVVHKLCSDSNIENYNKSYISTAIKWAIRNEVRRRYKWYSLNTRKTETPTDADHEDIRDAVYKTILSIDEMAESENPTQIKDSCKTPEENILFQELSNGIKEAIKKLPQREKDLIEAKFFQDKKLRELSEDFNISPSRISRIIQSGLVKIRKELEANHII